MAPTHTFFDHTGDYGVDLEGDDLDEVFSALTHAFLDLLTGAPESVLPTTEQSVEVRGMDEVDLLVSFGNELLFQFEMGFLAASLEIEDVGVCGDDLILRGRLRGEPFDPERHPIARPMKAVTHHQASFVCGPTSARARLVFDL